MSRKKSVVLFEEPQYYDNRVERSIDDDESDEENHDEASDEESEEVVIREEHYTGSTDTEPSRKFAVAKEKPIDFPKNYPSRHPRQGYSERDEDQELENYILSQYLESEVLEPAVEHTERIKGRRHNIVRLQAVPVPTNMGKHLNVVESSPTRRSSLREPQNVPPPSKKEKFFKKVPRIRSSSSSLVKDKPSGSDLANATVLTVSPDSDSREYLGTTVLQAQQPVEKKNSRSSWSGSFTRLLPRSSSSRSVTRLM